MFNYSIWVSNRNGHICHSDSARPADRATYAAAKNRRTMHGRVRAGLRVQGPHRPLARLQQAEISLAGGWWASCAARWGTATAAALMPRR